MSRRGNCHDNAVMESWFATVKSEEGEHFEGYAHAKAALFDYIEVFYSQRRRTRRSARSARRPSSACQRTPHSQTVHRIGSSQDNRRSVSVGTVRLTGKLTKAQAHLCAAGRRTHRFCVSQGQRCRSRGLCGLSCLLEMVVRTTFTRSVASTGVQ